MTRFNNKYPYTDFHELNADWLLETVKDAEAEAKEAADTVATYNDRLTTVEGDLAPIKAAMPGLASDVSGLRHDVGIMDSLITNTINPDIATLKSDLAPIKAAMPGLASDVSDLQHDVGIMDSLITNTINPDIATLKSEVETPTTGLLDRVTALENQPPGQSSITEYLRFGTSGTPIDWDARITYTYLDDLIATTASGDKNINIILVEDDELGTTWYYTLNEGEYQISAGTPRGQFTFVCRKPVLDGNNNVTGYKTCTVTVNKNAATPTYSEVYEAALPTVTSTDAGDVLTVDNNGNWTAATPGGGVSGTFTQGGGVNFDFADYIEYSDHILVNIRGTVTSPLNAGATIVTGGPAVSNSSNAVAVLASLNDYNPICIAYSTTGSIVIRPALNTGETFYISIMVLK